jgi:hypothetical protein
VKKLRLKVKEKQQSEKRNVLLKKLKMILCKMPLYRSFCVLLQEALSIKAFLIIRLY